MKNHKQIKIKITKEKKKKKKKKKEKKKRAHMMKWKELNCDLKKNLYSLTNDEWKEKNKNWFKVFGSFKLFLMEMTKDRQ